PDSASALTTPARAISRLGAKVGSTLPPASTCAIPARAIPPAWVKLPPIYQPPAPSPVAGGAPTPTPAHRYRSLIVSSGSRQQGAIRAWRHRGESPPCPYSPLYWN